MHRNQNKISEGGIIILLLVLINAIVLERGLVLHSQWYRVAYITVPLLLVSIIAFRRNSL